MSFKHSNHFLADEETKRYYLLGHKVIKFHVGQWAIGWWRSPLGTVVQFRHTRFLITPGGIR